MVHDTLDCVCRNDEIARTGCKRPGTVSFHCCGGILTPFECTNHRVNGS
jgi:hypothetical protein